MSEDSAAWEVRKSVTVAASIEDAFAVFTQHPTDWWPATHVLVENRERIVLEPAVGGRYYDVDVDGGECDWGRILVWDPPHALTMTWRIDGRWRSIPDDEFASEIEVRFTAAGPTTTEVELAHVKLYRHGPGHAEAIRAAIQGPSPGETLANYAKAVALHAAGWSVPNLASSRSTLPVNSPL